jgi:hypothetical protein
VLTPWRDKVRGLLEAWYPGQNGGTAIARVLFGDAEPGGRLPTTFPLREEDQPTSGDPERYPGVAERVTYEEDVLIGYRWFDERGLGVAYPFGHGLSYTSFGFSGLRIAPDGGTVSAVVRNTGGRRGTAVPQLYLGLPDPRPGVIQPPRVLKGFERVSLAPGESRRVTFALDDRAYAYWDERSAGWQVAPGCYSVSVGPSSRELPLGGVVSRGGARCAGELGLPGAGSGRTCTSRRSFLIRLREPRGSRERLRSARVVVRGRRVRVRRAGGRLVARIDLRGARAGRTVVRVVARTTQGRTLREARTYRTCGRRGG